MGKNILQTTNKRVRPLWLCPLIKKIFTLFIWLLLLPVTALAVDEHDSHSNNWTEFTAGTTTLSGGSYYLSGDVEYTGTESITVSGEVILCLNGHKLDLKGQHISVGSGASLTLCDCSTGGVVTGGSGSNGGGVYVGGGGTFTMTGGSIAGNTANAGGGVYVDEGGTFTMEDGSINNNKTTTGAGGGVHVYKGTFTMTGGSITGNTTNSDTFGYGGGVCLYGTFYLSGDAIIQNNTKAGATDNLYLGWNTINITGPLGENARIGVTAEGVPRSFISGWSDNMAGENPADYFSSDGDALGIGLNADGNVVLGSLCTTITLNPNGGTLPEYSLVAGAALPIPTKTGYTFAGWYEDPEFSGNPVTDIPTNNTENLTFYAKWTANTYTISANVTPANAGTVTVNGSDTSSTVTAGSEVTLTATANSGYRFTGWTSSNGGTFANASNAITTFTMPAGDVTVTAQFEKEVTSVSLNKNTLELYAGQSETLIATVTPDDATNQNVTWSSDNEAVATVDNSGKVTAVTAGEANITVKTEDGNYTASCKVQVRKLATVEASGSTNLSFTTDRDEFSLTATVHAQGNDLNPKDGSWTWAVADEDVVALSGSPTLLRAFVSSSRQAFTVEGTGTTTITATYDDGTYRGLVEFKVSISKPTPPDPISYYNIYVEDVCDGVEVTLSNNVVREGNSISVYVKKDTANYTFDNFKVYYKRSYYGTWDELKEGTQPGEYPIKNIWTHIYIKAEGTEEKEDPTGIESIEGVKVYTKDGSLYVQTPQREQVIIVSMSGAVVKNEEQIGLKQYHGLQPGIYIVRVGDRAYKLRLN